MPEELKSVLLEIVKKNINVPGLANDLIDSVLEPALKAAVAKSETKIDDIVVAALYPLLEDEVKKQVKLLWESLLAAKKPAEIPDEV